MAQVRGSLAAVSALAIALLGRVDAKTALLIQSADRTDDRLTSKGMLEVVPDFPFEGPTVIVGARFDQELLGWGGAFTESAALVFWALPEAQRKQLLELYFGHGGIGYTLGRTHINSCDFSPDYYSFDEEDGDFGLLHFDMNVTHDTGALIPFIQAAQQVLLEGGRELKLLVAPWSPPGWMKTNGQMLGSDRPGLKDSCKATWAKYISKWITAYKSRGIPIWALTPQNEPENDGIWESCVFNPKQELDFIAGSLGPILKEDHPEVEIFIFDHNKDHALEWAEALFSHPEALQYTAGIAFHWYTGDEFDSLAKIHHQFPKLAMISSEATYDQSRLHGASIADGNWDFALGYAHEILGDLNTGTNAWIDWNLLLNTHGGPNKVGNACDAPMVSDGETVHVHPQYYAIGHFSKYIPAGSMRLESSVLMTSRGRAGARPYGTCDGSDGLEATSFLRPDGRLAVVALNCGNLTMDFKLQFAGGAIRTSIPGRGIQTYVIDDADGTLVV